MQPRIRKHSYLDHRYQVRSIQGGVGGGDDTKSSSHTKHCKVPELVSHFYVPPTEGGGDILFLVRIALASA